MAKITSELLAKIAPGTKKALRDRFIPYFNECLPRYGINNELETAAFLTTVCFESDYFRATEEYASGIDYDITRNRKKALGLGNTEKGDGIRFKGRTLIQTTGRKNYRRLTEEFGKRDGVDFEKTPEKLAEVKYAVEGACVYWKDNNLNSYANKGKFFAIQGLVNRGRADRQAKDYPKRLAIYDKVLRVLPDDFDLEKVSAAGSSNPQESAPRAEVQPTGEVSEQLQSDSHSNQTIEQPPENQAQTETKVEIKDGSVKVETSENQSTEQEKVAIEKKTEEKAGFFSGIGAEITALVTGNGGFQALLDYAQRVAAFGLSERFWAMVGWIALGGSLLYLLIRYLKWRRKQDTSDKHTELLVTANSTPDNKVTLAAPEDLEMLKQNGYVIVERGK